MTQFFGIPIQPPTPEQIEEMKKAHEQAELESDDFRHALRRMIFEEMPVDHLRTLNRVLHGIEHSVGSDVPIVSFYEGLILATLDLKHGDCLACHKNHDDEIKKAFGKEDNVPDLDKAVSDAMEYSATATDPVAIMEAAIKDVDEARTKDALQALARRAKHETGNGRHDPRIGVLFYGQDDDGFTPQEHQQMQQYNLDRKYDVDTQLLVGYFCTNCKMDYPSIPDRMMKDVDECPGCIHKTKWG